jgi:hypothetical protein
LLYIFDNYALEPQRRELRSGATVATMEPQAFNLLLHLIRHRERVAGGLRRARSPPRAVAAYDLENLRAIDRHGRLQSKMQGVLEGLRLAGLPE